jgi:hypothetical protein
MFSFLFAPLASIPKDGVAASIPVKSEPNPREIGFAPIKQVATFNGANISQGSCRNWAKGNVFQRFRKKGTTWKLK